jgi:hypothetical protein
MRKAVAFVVLKVACPSPEWCCRGERGGNARHRAHARVEDGVRTSKDTGLGHLPSKTWTVNLVWLKLLGCPDIPTLAKAEPASLRYRLPHLPARLGLPYPSSFPTFGLIQSKTLGSLRWSVPSYLERSSSIPTSRKTCPPGA